MSKKKLGYPIAEHAHITMLLNNNSTNDSTIGCKYNSNNNMNNEPSKSLNDKSSKNLTNLSYEV
jgi:hypothetical protein